MRQNETPVPGGNGIQLLGLQPHSTDHCESKYYLWLQTLQNYS
jgi:hypothetical protein